MANQKITITSKHPEIDLLKELSNVGIKDFEQPKDGRLIFNDQWQRWGKRGNFRFIGSQQIYKGGVYTMGTFMDWSDTYNKIVCICWENEKVSLKVNDWKVLSPQIKKAEEKNTKKYFKEMMDEFLEVSGMHPYLNKKGIDSVKGLKENKTGDLCVPIHDLKDNKIVGIQRITKDGVKRNFIDSTMKGIFKVGEDTRKVFLCEGLADAITVNSITGNQAICCFGKEGLEKAARHLALENDTKQFIVCGDNPTKKYLGKVDMKDHNEYYRYYATLFKDLLNVLTIFPKGYNQKEGEFDKDFNDFYQRDYSSASYQLTQSVADIPYLKFLGFKNNKIYMYSSLNKGIHELKEGSKHSLYLIAPDTYWKNKFIGISESGIIKALFNATSKIIYDQSRIRFAGMYRNETNHEIIINTGEKVIGEPDGKHIYILAGSFPDPKTLPDFDKAKHWSLLTDKAFHELAFESKYDIYILTAFTILSIASRIINFRFSVHLISESSTGKSFLIENYVKALLSGVEGAFKQVAPATTFASIKEILSLHSLVCFEERKDMVDQKRNSAELLSSIIRDMSSSPVIIEKKASTKVGDRDFLEVGCNVLETYNSGSNDIKADRERIIFLSLIREKQLQKDFHSVNHLFAKDQIAYMGKCMIGSFLKNYSKFEEEHHAFCVSKHSLTYEDNEGISFHKMRIYGQIFSFIKTMDLLSDDELKKMIEYVKEKEALNVEQADYHGIISTLLFKAKVWHKKDSDTIANILQKFIWGRDDDAPFDNSLDFYVDMIQQTRGICFGIYKGVACIRIPKDSEFIYDVISRSKNPQFANNYVKILRQKYKTCQYRLPAVTCENNKKMMGVAVPVDEIFNDETSRRVLRILNDRSKNLT